MLKLIKKFFSIEKEIVSERVGLDKIEKWYEEKSVSVFSNFNSQLEEFNSRIKEKIALTKEHLDNLNSAELQNPNIPYKAKQYMEGNREAYIKAINAFTSNNLKHDFTSNDHESITSFTSNFEKDLELLGKSTFRSYQILSEFFANELALISSDIKSFETIMKELNNLLLSSGVNTAKKLTDDIKNLNIKISLKKNLKGDLQEEEKKLIEIESSLEKLKEDSSSLLKSQEFIDYENEKKTKYELQSKLKSHKDMIFQYFSTIEKALKKYSRIAISNEELIVEYTYSAENALLKDPELKLLEILSRLESSIKENKIALKLFQ